MYLRAEKLLPGDVLLSSGSGKVANIIKKTTGGQFSHAAIVVWTNMIFEATTDGLGYSFLELVKVEKLKHDVLDKYKSVEMSDFDYPKYFEALNKYTEESRYPLKVFCDISKYKNFAVYRHQNNIGIQDMEPSERISEIAASLDGLEYPKLVNLAKASNYLSKYPALKEKILNIVGNIAARDNQKLAEGMFCSELVTYILRRIGLEPFKELTHPSYVSPNLFANSDLSNMVFMNDMYADLDASLENDEEGFKMYSPYPISRPDRPKEAELDKAITQFLENSFQSIQWLLENRKEDGGLDSSSS